MGSQTISAKIRVKYIHFYCDQIIKWKKNPDITIETLFELWMDIISGKADGQQMFMEQKYTIKDDHSLMIQLFNKETN